MWVFKSLHDNKCVAWPEEHLKMNNYPITETPLESDWSNDWHETGLTLGLVREQEAGLQAFLSHDGFSVLMRGMQSENEKLRTKSAFLLLNLLTSHPEHKGKLWGDD